MKSYANDPRVSRDPGVSDEAYNVVTPDGDRYVYQDDGGWMTSGWSKDDEVRGPFVTADDAIHSLIGDAR